MNKAKIMLLVIAIMVGVGGGLAFKAQKYHRNNVFCSTNVGTSCIRTNFQTTPLDDVMPVTTPCHTYHGIVAGDPVTPSTTQYYTTSNCTQLINDNVWSTNDD